MGQGGYVKIWRRILENPWMSDTQVFALWIHLLLMAAHKPVDCVFNGQRITLTPGQLITSRSELVKKTNINRSKIERTLKLFENEQQIEQRGCSTSRLITIINWKVYQEREQQIEQRVSSGRAASEQRVSSLEAARKKEGEESKKNKNKEKIISNDIIQKKKNNSENRGERDLSESLIVANRLKSIIESKRQIAKTNGMMRKWALEIDKINRLDKIDWTRVSVALDYYEHHIGEQYCPEIYSGASFRDKFVKLESAMSRESRTSRDKESWLYV